MQKGNKGMIVKEDKNWLAKSLQCVGYDLREGLLKFYPLYLIGAVVVGIFSYSAWLELSFLVENPGVLELNIRFFKGMQVYQYVQGGSGLQIPMNYLAFSLVACMLACYYSQREWKLRGSIFISRYQSKGIWWMSKCILCVMQVLIFYAITFLVSWMIAGVHGNWGFAVREEISVFCEGVLSTTEPLQIIGYVYLLGICTSIAINQMITSLQMMCSAVVGYVAAIALLISASCLNQAYILGNNLMLLRTKVLDEMGISIGQGLFWAGLFWIVFLIIGKIAVEKKDVL